MSHPSIVAGTSSRERIPRVSNSLDHDRSVRSSRQPVLQPVSFLKLIFDTVSLIIVFLSWLLLKYLVKPVRRSFLCSDLSLYHPPPEKKVFPTWLLFVCAIIIPLIVVSMASDTRPILSVRHCLDHSIGGCALVLSASQEGGACRLSDSVPFEGAQYP